MNDVKTTRCVICYNEFSEKQLIGADCCPSCGGKGVPCRIEDDVTVKTNWHELRILCCWAERFAVRIEEENPSSIVTLDCIVQRLQKQYPDKTPLTIRGEVGGLREQFPDAKLMDEHGNEIET